MSDNNPQPYSVISNILRSIIDGTEYDGPADSRIAQLLLELKATIEGLPQPMVFKGTLGIDGDITSLPAASDDNKGFVYVVITAGTYAGQSANVGDMFISTGEAWSYVPSGDVVPWKVLSSTLTAGQTTITFTDSAITANSLIDVYAPVWYSDLVQSAGSVVLTFPVQTSDISISIRVS